VTFTVIATPAANLTIYFQDIANGIMILGSMTNPSGVATMSYSSATGKHLAVRGYVSDVVHHGSIFSGVRSVTFFEDSGSQVYNEIGESASCHSNYLAIAAKVMDRSRNPLSGSLTLYVDNVQFATASLGTSGESGNIDVSAHKTSSFASYYTGTTPGANIQTWIIC